jgi:iron(III) transport system substrate-binding protein
MAHRSRSVRFTHRSCRRVVSVALSAILAASLLPACTDDSGSLTVYSGRNEDLVGPLLSRFAEETGIDIDIRYGDSPDLALLVAEEGDKSPADVFLSQSPGAVAYLDEHGLLRALPDSVLDAVDPQYEAADGHWVGLSGRRRTIVYNEDLVDPADLPESVLDLADAEFAGEVGIAPSNASFQDFVTAMRAQLGDDATVEWLQAMADNDQPTYTNNVAIVEAVGRGEIPLGLVNHYYNEQALAEDPELPSRNHFFPGDDLGAMVLVTAASVLSSSDASEEAVRFVEFLLEADAQRYFSEETFEYPLAAGVEPTGDLPPLDGLTVADIDYDALGGGFERTLELIDESGISS